MPWRRAPEWVLAGGGALALTAGYVNAIGYLGISQRGVSHVTGQVTQLGLDLSTGSFKEAAGAALLAGSFFAGATLSGVLIRKPELNVRSARYGWALLVEALLLGVGASVLPSARGWAENLIAAAMGLQNALASSYSGAVVRTTHVTGLFTDLGLAVGHALRGEAIEPLRFRLLATLAVAFVAGAALGGVGFTWLGALSLTLPAVAIACLGAGFLLWPRRAQHQQP